MTYTVTYTRPYLPYPERDDIQREQIAARDEEQVRSIFADCDVINVDTDQEELALVWAAEQTKANERASAEYVRALEDEADWLDHIQTQESVRP